MSFIELGISNESNANAYFIVITIVNDIKHTTFETQHVRLVISPTLRHDLYDYPTTSRFVHWLSTFVLAWPLRSGVFPECR
jgi:hypothetical protein